MGGLQAKSMTSQRNRAVRRWRICVTMATLWQQQDGGYALLFYIFNSTVIDWTCSPPPPILPTHPPIQLVTDALPTRLLLVPTFKMTRVVLQTPRMPSTHSRWLTTGWRDMVRTSETTGMFLLTTKFKPTRQHVFPPIRHTRLKLYFLVFFFKRHAMKICTLTWPLDGVGWPDSRSGRLISRDGLLLPVEWGIIWSQSWSGRFVGEKNLLFLPEIELLSFLSSRT